MTTEAPADITGLLVAWRRGDRQALSDLMALTYESLKEIAGRLLEQESGAETLQTTALVHEAYLRLWRLERIEWGDRAHFFAMSARMMRRVLVDHARRRSRSKRGAGAVVIAVDELRHGTADTAPDLLDVDLAMRQLTAHDPERARIVELRFFGGMNREEIAEVVGLSPATVARRWRSARAWLLHRLDEESR